MRLLAPDKVTFLVLDEDGEPSEELGGWNIIANGTVAKIDGSQAQASLESIESGFRIERPGS